MNSIVRLVRREPVRAYSFLVGLVALAVSFGLPLTMEQQGLLVGLFAIVLGVGSEAVRGRVSPIDRD